MLLPTAPSAAPSSGGTCQPAIELRDHAKMVATLVNCYVSLVAVDRLLGLDSSGTFKYHPQTDFISGLFGGLIGAVFTLILANAALLQELGYYISEDRFILDHYAKDYKSKTLKGHHAHFIVIRPLGT